MDRALLVVFTGQLLGLWQPGTVIRQVNRALHPAAHSSLMARPQKRQRCSGANGAVPAAARAERHPHGWLGAGAGDLANRYALVSSGSSTHCRPCTVSGDDTTCNEPHEGAQLDWCGKQLSNKVGVVRD